MTETLNSPAALTADIVGYSIDAVKSDDVAPASRNWREAKRAKPLRANDAETSDRREFTVEGRG